MTNMVVQNPGRVRSSVSYSQSCSPPSGSLTVLFNFMITLVCTTLYKLTSDQLAARSNIKCG